MLGRTSFHAAGGQWAGALRLALKRRFFAGLVLDDRPAQLATAAPLLHCMFPFLRIDRLGNYGGVGALLWLPKLSGRNGKTSGRSGGDRTFSTPVRTRHSGVVWESYRGAAIIPARFWWVR